MDQGLIWKTLTVFNFSFFIIWVSFFTYRANFYRQDDFVDGDTGNRGENNPKNNPDSALSYPGRSMTFLIAIISALVVSILFFYLYNYLVKPTFKCKKGAKSLKECKLIK